MPSIKAIEARLPVADVARSAEFFATTLGFEIGTFLWPQQAPEFAILNRDGLRLQLGKDESAGSGPGTSPPRYGSMSRSWPHCMPESRNKPVSRGDLRSISTVGGSSDSEIPDGNLVILSEVTSDPPSCTAA